MCANRLINFFFSPFIVITITTICIAISYAVVNSLIDPQKLLQKKTFISINVHFLYTISPFSHGCWYSSKIHLRNIILLDWYEYLCSCQCLHFINHRYHFLGESSPISRMITFYLSHFFSIFNKAKLKPSKNIDKLTSEIDIDSIWYCLLCAAWCHCDTVQCAYLSYHASMEYVCMLCNNHKTITHIIHLNIELLSHFTLGIR